MKININKIFALTFTLLMSISEMALAAYTPVFATDQITSEQWGKYFDEVRKSPDAQTFEKLAPNQIIVQIKGTNVVYIFTAETHPAHPAFVRRWIEVDKNGDVRFMRVGHYAGDRKAFTNWQQEFDDLDKKAKEQIRSRLAEQNAK